MSVPISPIKVLGVLHAEAGDLVELGDLPLVRLAQGGDLLVQHGDLGAVVVDVVQHHRRVCQILCARGLLPVRFRMFIRCLFFALSDAVVPVLRPALKESDLPCCSGLMLRVPVITALCSFRVRCLILRGSRSGRSLL
jgi:hypothetical protein